MYWCRATSCHPIPPDHPATAPMLLQRAGRQWAVVPLTLKSKKHHPSSPAYPPVRLPFAAVQLRQVYAALLLPSAHSLHMPPSVPTRRALQYYYCTPSYCCRLTISLQQQQLFENEKNTNKHLLPVARCSQRNIHIYCCYLAYVCVSTRNNEQHSGICMYITAIAPSPQLETKPPASFYYCHFHCYPALSLLPQ